LIISEHGHWEYINAGTGKTSDVRRGDGEVPMLNQALNHQKSHNLNRGLANMCGDGVFCGTDYLAYPSGTIDKFRIPKFSYYFWQSQRDPNLIIPGINSGPMVYIANYWTAASPTAVKVFSNCEQVKLYRNNVLTAAQMPDSDVNSTNLPHPPFTFTGLTFQSGELKAEGYIGGQLAATHIVKTPGSATTLNISFNLSNLKVGGDIAFVYVSVLDANGTVVPTPSKSITLAITSGPAALVGPAAVSSEAGIAAFLLRSTTTPGLITVQATASGLIPDNASITSE
jgi:beta-galactosidase